LKSSIEREVSKAVAGSKDEILDERARELLREIVRTHAETGRPVSSRTLSKVQRLHASPATLRNTMADLTDLGYLSQPHTSAGRIPTEKGYRYYVRTLMKPREVTVRQRRAVSSDLEIAGHDPERLYPAVSKLLARMTGEVGLVIAPDARGSIVREIRFLPIGRDKALAIHVGEGDRVFTRLIETGGRLDAAALERAGNYLTARFAGATLEAIRTRIRSAMQKDRAQVDRMVSESLELARRIIASQDRADVYTEGAQRLLDRPEFSAPETIKRIYRAFEEKADLIELLDSVLEGAGPQVVIGSQSHLTADTALSAVVTRYGGQDEPGGLVGIIGSLRMPYPKVIPLVEFFGRALSERLREASEGEGEHG
jgi:heat-inducible transcriptional repressor